MALAQAGRLTNRLRDALAHATLGTGMGRRHFIGLAALAWLLATGGVASAAETLGDPQLKVGTHDAAACNGPECTYAMHVLGSATPAVPSKGVIVRWRLGSGDGNARVTLRALARVDNTATYVGTGTGIERTTAVGVNVFEGERLPVQAGQFLGVDDEDGAKLFTVAPAGVGVRFWLPKLQDGAPPRAISGHNDGRALELNADLERDVDGDGFGDETQDGCPGDPALQAPPCAVGTSNPGVTPPPLPPPSAPAIAGLRVAPKRFRLGSLARIRFDLSKAATYTLAFDQLRPGRRRGARCLPRSRRVRTGRRCTAFVRRGVRRGAGKSGVNAVAFRGRLGKRRLPPGRYRVTASARDADGLTARSRTARFTLRPQARRRR